MTIKFTFTKLGDMKFISHLDLMRLFQRAARRAHVPAAISQGFNPHMKISIKHALKLGIESNAEQASYVLYNVIEEKEFIDKLNKQLPIGIRVIDAQIE